MNGHARSGGQIGCNGAFYEGGQFLPSTMREKGTASGRRGKRNVQVEPYLWRVYEGKLGEDEIAMGFYRILLPDFKTVYLYNGRSEAEYEAYTAPYRNAWDEGKRIVILRREKGQPPAIVRFE